jgi:hypothetical protein
MKYILLLIPCVLACIAPFYNTLAPTLLGFPFFYWYQLLLVPIGSIFVYAAYRMERGGR